MSDPQAIEKRQERTRRSVTRDNAFPIDRGGGYFQILVPSVQPQTGLLPAYLPLDFRQRDRVLDSTVRADAMWSAAIGIAITKAAAMAWEAKSDTSFRSKKAQELLLSADSTSISGIGGWVSYLGKQVRNFTCGNGGCYTEIIRATGAYGSRIVGLGHLSALRMRRTGDPEYPFIYIDRWGRQHVMKWWQVFNLVDMPDPDEAALGVGLCAAERAYQQIRKLAALEQYLYEKISGSRPLALHIVNGLTKDQLSDMMASASENQASKGLSLYMGAIVATTLKPDSAPALVTIPLAELPDGFEAATERDRADLIYANALGLDPQDLKPISNQQMGAGAQSEVLNQKAEGRGQAAYRQQLVHMLNQLVFDDKTQFLFTEHDYRDQQAAAAVSTARGAFVTGLVGGQILSPAQGLQILAEQGEVPKALVEQGAQAGADLSDTDKPDVSDPLNDQSGPPQPTAQPVMQTQAPTSPSAPNVPITPSTPPAAPAATTVPPTGDAVLPTKPVVKKALSPHHVQQRAVQAGARRILRQIERKGAISTKGWVTIHGHPVLIGAPDSGGGGGGGISGGSAGVGGGKKPAKGYVPKPGAGGSSIYPTLDAYKKGTISHEDALVKLKQDIKDAKLAGNTKAVNSLTSHYYAMKNGPHAKAEAPGTLKPPSPIKTSPSISEHEAKLTAHNITEAYVNDTITYSKMESELTTLGAKSGHTNDELKALAKTHEEALHAAGKAAPLKDVGTVSAPHPDAFKPLEGTPIHDHAMVVDMGIQKGTANSAEVANFHATVQMQIKQAQEKADLTQKAMQSGKDAGFEPLPSIVASHQKAKAEVAALNALEAHVTASEGLYGVKKANIGGIDPTDLQAAVNISSMHDKGTLTLTQYDKTMNTMAAKMGVTKAELEGHVFGAKLAGAKAALVGPSPSPTGPSGALQSAAYGAHVNQASVLMHQYDTDQISHEEYMTGIANIAHQHNMSQAALSQQVHTMHEALGGIQATTSASVSTIQHHGQAFTTISSVSAAHDWGGQQQWAKPLTVAEKKSMYDYSYQGDEAINKKLRFGQDLDYPDLKPAQEPARVASNIAHLDAVMARSSVPTNVQVHRGFSNPELLRRMDAGLPLEGAVFRDDGFVSTAVSKNSRFTNMIITQIHVPAGSQGAYIAPHVKADYRKETELLLPRGSNFRITGYQKVKDSFGSGYHYELDMDYLGPQEVPGAFKAHF